MDTEMKTLKEQLEESNKKLSDVNLDQEAEVKNLKEQFQENN